MRIYGVGNPGRWQTVEYVDIDTSTAAERLVAGVLGSIAEFERARIQERIHAGLRRAKSQAKWAHGQAFLAKPSRLPIPGTTATTARASYHRR